MKDTHFNGPCYEPAADHARLMSQLEIIKSVVLGGQWRTLAEIEKITGYPQASISAQLRHLRKERFGSYRVCRRKRIGPSAGLYEYQVLPPAIKQDVSGQMRFA